MISSSFRQIHVTTRVSQCAKLKKKIPWQILFIIYHIPCRRKPRSIWHAWSPSNGELCGLQTVLWDYAYTCTHMLITTLFDCRYSSIRKAPLCGRPIVNSLSPTVVSLIKGCKVTLNKVSRSRSNETRTFFKCVYTLPLALSGLYFTSTELF